MVQQRRLVALDDKDEIAPALLHDRARRLHLRVQRIHQGDGAVQVQPFQQRLARRNLVALVGHRFDTQHPSAARVDGSDQLRAPAAPNRLAIQHHHVAIVAAQARLLPRPHGLLKRQHRHRLEHPINAVLTRSFVAALPLVEPAPKRRSLSGCQILGKEGHAAVAAPASRKQIREERDSQLQASGGAVVQGTLNSVTAVETTRSSPVSTSTTASVNVSSAAELESASNNQRGLIQTQELEVKN